MKQNFFKIWEIIIFKEIEGEEYFCWIIGKEPPIQSRIISLLRIIQVSDLISIILKNIFFGNLGFKIIYFFYERYIEYHNLHETILQIKKLYIREGECLSIFYFGGESGAGCSSFISWSLALQIGHSPLI